MTATFIAEAENYLNCNGKMVYVYVVEADSLRDALEAIPGDFKLHWWNQHLTTFTIEVVRTF